jgi:hypothetical protein
MPTTVGLRKILDVKAWETLAPTPVANTSGMICVPSTTADPHQAVLVVTALATAWLYYPDEDAWGEIPTPSLSGTLNPACGVWHPGGPTGTTTAGTTTTISTNYTTIRSLVGYKIRLTGGTGAGQEGLITAHVIGANTVFTVASWTNTSAAAISAPDATTTWQLRTGNFYVLMGGTTAAGSFKRFDMASSSWSGSLGVTNLPASLGTDITMVAGHSTGFITTPRKATAGAAATLTDAVAPSWTANQWANFQVRILGGTGAGQVRTVASNTATVLTVTANWTTIPDTTSYYQIEPNEDWVYLLGNGAVTLYRYSISGNTWAVITPSVARTAAPGNPAAACFVDGETATDWTSEAAILNGRRIYSMRGNGTSSFDIYDIPGNTWQAAPAVGGTAAVGYGVGSQAIYFNGTLYTVKDQTGRAYRTSLGAGLIEPLSTIEYPYTTQSNSAHTWGVKYVDGSTTIPYLYHWIAGTTVLQRCLLF